MALSRRTGVRFQASIWPGFVDAMTGLLLVLMFVLTIVMVIQFVLQETIKGQGSELDVLSSSIQQKDLELSKLSDQISTLGTALGMERELAIRLRDEVADLDASLSNAQADGRTQLAQIKALKSERDASAAKLENANTVITDFELQVAGLLVSQKQKQNEINEFSIQVFQLQTIQGQANTEILEFETQVSLLLSEKTQDKKEILNFETQIQKLIDTQIQNRQNIETIEGERASIQQSLLAAQATIQEKIAAAALANSKQKFMDKMIADLSRSLDRNEIELNRLRGSIDNSDAVLNAKDIQRLAEAAAAEQLRKELEGSTAALSSLTLQLNAEREKAEETLTLLAAAQNAESNLSEVTAAALTEAEKINALLAVSQAELKRVKDISSESQRQAVVLSQEVAALRSQISFLQTTLGQMESEDEANEIEIVNLGKSLNNALARVALAEKKNAQFLAVENERLEAEAAILQAKAESLEGYKSKFFGEVRKSLEGQKGVKLVGDRFVFSSEVLFASAEAELTDQGKNEIAEIAALIQGATRKMPNTIDWILQVDGHTDNQAISSGAQFADNWELSQARALSVVQFLVKEQSMDPARLSANGFAQFQPVNADNTSEARAQNRRIELKLTEKQSYTD
ncbi:MAG: peptidoglycan -binding protein, partial [Planktomarina sp.]|nr:peptidoglycan -binding protein [Planktomarina sp.]